MSKDGSQARGGAHAWMRNNVLGLVAIFIALNGTAIAAQVASGGEKSKKAAKAKPKAKPGPPGPQGPAGSQGAQGQVGPPGQQGIQGPPGNTTGAAGGALAGTYPNPTLNVSGGPCPNGREVSNVSSTAVITCSSGVYNDGAENVAAGPTAFPSIAGGVFNSALGQGALASNATGSTNSAFGRQVLAANTIGIENSAFGAEAMNVNVDGNANSAFGTGSLDSNTTGDDNSAFGRGALSANTANGNTAVGRDALLSNTAGVGNTAVGKDALRSNTTGAGNSAFGEGALPLNAGNFNTAVGNVAMDSNSAGNGNTVIGAGAADGLTSGSNNIVIDDDVAAPAESSTIRIGDAQARAFIEGIRGKTTGVADAIPVLIDSAGQLGTISSSRRYKHDIEALGSQSDPLMKLDPVSFRYREGPDELHYGLIAEQVAKVMPTLAVFNEEGLPETVQYQDLPVLLLNELQEQRRQSRALAERVRSQQEQIDWLMRRAGGR